MGLKKKSKVSAEFSMSSLTDIIFLLLIFFMLTSSMVVPNALNLKIPGKTTPASIKVNTPPPVVGIRADGTLTLNGTRISKKNLVAAVRKEKNKNRSKATIIIQPNAKASNEHVVYVMDLAYRFQIQAVMK